MYPHIVYYTYIVFIGSYNCLNTLGKSQCNNCYVNIATHMYNVFNTSRCSQLRSFRNSTMSRNLLRKAKKAKACCYKFFNWSSVRIGRRLVAWCNNRASLFLIFYSSYFWGLCLYRHVSPIIPWYSQCQRNGMIIIDDATPYWLIIFLHFPPFH